jgi:hypothetical protein
MDASKPALLQLQHDEQANKHKHAEPEAVQAGIVEMAVFGDSNGPACSSNRFGCVAANAYARQRRLGICKWPEDIEKISHLPTTATRSNKRWARFEYHDCFDRRRA